MRRSAAPSQTGGGSLAKRPKFVSPAIANTNKNVIVSLNNNTSSNITGAIDKYSHNYATCLRDNTSTFLQEPSMSLTAVVNNRKQPSAIIESNESMQTPESAVSSRLSSDVCSAPSFSLFKHVIKNKETITECLSISNGSDKVSSHTNIPHKKKTWNQDQLLLNTTMDTASRTQEEAECPAISLSDCKPLKTTFKCPSFPSLDHMSPKDAGNREFTNDLYELSVTPLSGPAIRGTTSRGKFSANTHRAQEQGSPQQEESHFGDASNKTSSVRYFSAVWCKMSKKKHKKWEGDAVLTTSGRTATLYDMDGKIIGKGSGYKTTELETLKEDETLFIGGKEIQIMSALTEEHFKSGKCFTSANELPSLTHNDRNPTRNLGISTPFQKPSLKSGQPTLLNKTTTEKHLAAPKFDPNTPHALVMPRPSADHQFKYESIHPQWRHNRQGLPIVDVVVDPYLSSELRSHQRAGVIFLYECVLGMRDYQGLGAILADDMGLGKTLQCISLLWTLLKQGPYGGCPVAKRVLVVTPGSLVKNWFLEFKKWLGTERLNVFAVSTDNRVDEFVKSNLYPVLVISYEMFVRCYELLKQVPFDLIICDEGHRLKNTAIKTTSLIMSLPCRRRVVLTGTPVQNDLQEFYSIVEFCNPGILGTSSAFRHIYEDPIVAFRQPKATVEQHELGTERAQELTRLTQMFVLRRTQEINNDYLPPKVEIVLFCKPTPLQLTLYRQLLHSTLIRRCLAGNFSGSPHLVCIGALKHLCNHPGLIYRKAAEEQLRRRDSALSSRDENADFRNDNSEDSIYSGLLSYFPDTFDASTVSHVDSGKLMVLSGLLASIWRQSASEKVVLVSNHTKILDFLEVFCKLHGYVFLRLDGQTPTAQRQDIVSKFNNKSSPFRVFLLSSKAGGVGLNLIGASRLILYDIDWNPANDLQAMARVWRDGQKGKVYIYRLLTVGTIEEKMYQRQITKQGLSGTVMDLTRKNNVHFSLEDLKDLFSLNEKTDCETHSMLSCSCEGDPSYTLEETAADVLIEQRQCQLGRPSINKQTKVSNLTMAELSQWKHWRAEFVEDQKNWRLDQAGPSLSFVFWNETSAV